MSSLKTSRVLLISAQRGEDTASLLQTDIGAAAVRLYLDVSDAPGSGGLTVVLRGYDKISGRSVELSTGGVAVTAIGTYAYEVTNAPSDAFGNIMEAVSRTIPYQWDAIVKHADNASYNYSLSAEIVS